MDAELASGSTAAPTSVIGKMIWQTVSVDSFTLMEIYMKVNGKKIKLMDMELIFIKMDQHI